MTLRNKTIITLLLSCLTLLIFFTPIQAGQDQIDATKETKESVSSKLNSCLQSNTININNYKNLQILYSNLLSEKKVIEQKLKTLEDTQKETVENKSLEEERQRAVNDLENIKNSSRKIFYFLIGALIAFALNRYFSTKAKYYLVAEKYSLAKLFGIIGFIFLGTFIVLIILFLYFLLRLAF